MYLSQDRKPINYLKEKIADVINSINKNQRAIIITQNGEKRGNTIKQEEMFKD